MGESGVCRQMMLVERQGQDAQWIQSVKTSGLKVLVAV